VQKENKIMPDIPINSPQEEKQIEVATLSDGSAVNLWCLSQFNNLVANQETIWDILNITTKLAHLNVTKDENGHVTDVELTLPQVSEVVTLFALRNFMEHQSLREENDILSPETILELRRLKLQKYLKEEGNLHD
jgi:hypothetical protein